MSGVVFSILYYSDEGTKSISLATMEYMNQIRHFTSLGIS